MQFYITDHESARIVGERLDAVAGRMDDLIVAFEEVFADMLIITATQIRSEGRRGGGSYAPLKPDTVRKKGDSRILYTEGANDKYTKYGNDTLVKSVTEAGAQFQIKQITPAGILFGTDRPFANVHQRGLSKRNIPARPFLQILQSDVDRWSDIMSRYMLEPLIAELV